MKTSMIESKIQQMQIELVDYIEYKTQVSAWASGKEKIELLAALKMLHSVNSKAEDLRRVFVDLVINQKMNPADAAATVYQAIENTNNWDETDKFTFALLV